ncbi:hypothetical protein DL771_007283 [Monosporascus sp. 5C6A]|nr:hypothetical protein DL771_007283 [Monosporascus sp. 5C6A]
MDSIPNVPPLHYPQMSLEDRPGTEYSSMPPSPAPFAQGLSFEPYCEYRELQPSASAFRSQAHENGSKSQCAFIHGVVNDCARSRFWNRIAEIYLLDLDTTKSQGYRCPLSSCTEVYPCPKQMLLTPRFHSGGSEEILHTFNQSAKTGAVLEFTSDQMLIGPPEMADTSVRTSFLKQRAYKFNGGTGIGDTRIIELRDTSRPAELGDTAIIPEDNDSGNYSILCSDNEPISSSQEPASARELSFHEPATEISSPSASRPEGSPTSVSTASLENESNQKYASQGASLHRQEALFNGNNPLSAKTSEMPAIVTTFPDPDAPSPMQFQSAADVAFQEPWHMELFASPETPVTTVFKHTSIHAAKPSVPPIVTSWSASDYELFPFGRWTQSQCLEAFNFGIASTPPATAVTDLCDSFVNTDVKAGTIYPSDSQNDTGGFVSICDTPPSSQSATSSSNSNTSFESEKAEHEDLKCPQCGFRPSGKPKNHMAYLRQCDITCEEDPLSHERHRREAAPQK